MARILLINTNREGGLWTVLPAGLCAVANAADARGHDVRTLDLRFERHPAEALRRAIRRHTPQILAMSIRNIDSLSRTNNRFYLEEIRNELMPAARMAGVPILLGGPAVAVGGQELLDFIGADYAIAGEGEEAFPDLVEALEKGQEPRGAAGLLRRGVKPASDFAPARADDLKSLSPLNAAKWLRLTPYWDAGANYPLLTKRGCPFHCVYCTYPLIEGSICRLRDPAAVADELARAYGDGARRFEFVDSVFGLPRDHAIAVCEAIAGLGLRSMSLHAAGFHPLGATTDLLDAFEKAGGRSVLCTPDSFSKAGLAGLNKGFGPSAAERAAEVLRHRRNLNVCWFLILGGPGESDQSIHESLDFAEHRIPRHHVVVVSTGLRMYDNAPLLEIARSQGVLHNGESLLRPANYIEPSIDVEALREKIVATAKRCPNIVFMGEEPHDPFVKMLVWRTLKLMAGHRPLWTALPRLFRVLGRLGIRDANPANQLSSA